MATPLTREQILARKVGRGTVTLLDGAVVHVRALTRDEVLTMRGLDSLAEQDNYVISTGMIAPRLSLEDVAAWATTGDAGDLALVSEEIAAVSGLSAKSGKAATKSAT